MTELPEVAGISAYFCKDGKDWPRVEPNNATSVILSDGYKRVEFAWPDEAEKARSVMKMIRDARNAGSEEKASEICAALGINSEFRS